MIGPVTATRSNSRWYSLNGKCAHWGYHDTGPVEYARRSIAILEASPTPMTQAILARKSGYQALNLGGIQTWLMCLTFLDDRVYEEDDARLGLIGVHRTPEDIQLFDDSMTWAYSPSWSLPVDTILFIASEISGGKTCRWIAEEYGINRNVVDRVRRRMKKEGVL